MSVKRALVIDGQIFQSFSLHRGMGKYSLSLLKAMIGEIEFYDKKILIFNEHTPLNTDTQTTLKDLLDDFEFVNVGYRSFSDIEQYREVRLYNKGVIDNFLQSMLKDYKVDVMIMSLFEDKMVPVFPSNCANKYMVIYDLIPLQFFNPYLNDEYLRKNYLYRFDTLIESDHFFPISDTVANDLALNLGIPKKRITPIYGAPIKRRHLGKKEIAGLKATKYILMPSGDDFRKNNLRAALAFEAFNKTQDREYKLVITSTFSDYTKKKIHHASRDVIFTGNVSEDELAWLYDNATLVLFPTEYEGLGLPVLEAIEFKKPIVCSDIPVFREISETAINFCDPYTTSSVKDTIALTIKNPEVDTKQYKAILDKYSWKRSATLAIKTLRTLPKEKRPKKQKVAIFTPNPSGFSGVGKVVQEQHYELSRYADVTYFIERGITDKAQRTRVRQNFIEYAAVTKDPYELDETLFQSFDRVIYHIGNGEYHVQTLIKALSYPDEIVIHDTRIKGLYMVAVHYGYLPGARFNVEVKLNDLVKSDHGEFLVSIVNKQNRVVVHSDYARKAIEDVIQTPSRVIVLQQNLAIPAPCKIFHSMRQKEKVVAMAGVMTEAKGMKLVESIMENQNIKVKIFGFSMLPIDVEQKLKIMSGVDVVISPTDTRYLQELAQSDIVLNFRDPYHGETSYSTLEGLRLGKDVIVNNTGWFAELPTTLVEKIDSSDDIVSTLQKITPSNNTSDARVDYIRDKFSIEKYVKGLL